MSITGLAIRKSTTVLFLVVFISIVGIYCYVTLPRDAAPDIPIPYMIITTIYPGVAPTDIETIITRPIEQELKTLKDVREISSSSSESFSVIAIEFEPDVDLDFALQKVKDKVDSARSEIPDNVEDPVVTEIDFENMPILNIILTADYDLVKLKDVAEDISDRLETIPGVLEARITGGLEREVQINVDPNRLKDYNLSFFDVYGTVMDEHVNIPAGTMDIGDFTYSVRVPGELKDPYGFRDLVVTASSKGPVYIRDLADVNYGFKDQTTISRLDGKSSITIGMTKRAGENIVRIADSAKKIVEEMKPNLPNGTHITIGTDFSKFIRIMIEDLENNIVSGFVLVIVSIFLFLGLTSSFFVAVSIPLSMLITFAVLTIMNITLNMIVLFSLILALGMLVDNAIVIVENIYRHRHMGYGEAEASEKATNQVGMAVTTSTLTTVCAFLPLIFWPGIMGKFMSFMPITIIIALSASLFVGLIINPVLCFRFMKIKSGDKDKFTSGSGFFGGVLKFYERVLTWAVKHPKTILSTAFLVLAVTVVSYGLFGHGVELFPSVDPDSVWIDVKGPVGTRLETTDAIAKQLEGAASKFPDIKTIITNVGVSTSSSGLGGGFDTSNEARIYMDFEDFEDRSQRSLKTFNESVNKVKFITGADVELNVEEMGPPVGEPVEIQISGEDFLLLGEIARDIRDKIKQTPGLVDLKDDFESSKPELVFRVDREKAKILDISTLEIASAVRTAISGFDAGDFRDGEDDYQITVRFAEQNRNSMLDLDKIYVKKEDNQIPLSSLGSYESSAGFGTIRRVDLKRVVTITGSNHGRLSRDVLNDVKAELANYKLPSGYGIRYSGENEDAQEASAFLLKALVIAIFLIALVLITQFDSIVLPFIIISSVILSLIGVLWGILISGFPFGIIMTGVGVISLAGVVVNNAIVLLDYTIKLREMGKGKMEAIIEAGKTRFRPVMLTAITTILGIIPLATGWSFNVHTLTFSAGGAMAQWWAPMAVAIIYGLGVATILTLVVVPSLYMILGRKEHDTYFEEHKIPCPETGS